MSSKKSRRAALLTKKIRANNCATKNGVANITRTALPNRFAKWERQQAWPNAVPASHSMLKKGGFETIVDKSLDIHRMTCE
ncbi:hypothetical protein ABIE30_004995 [Janthinobacterium lividum]|uniref:hypothetical protein n=1 Tax=Janthinobacterium lividum TaxID=29581 RepID=UPI003D1A058D